MFRGTNVLLCLALVASLAFSGCMKKKEKTTTSVQRYDHRLETMRKNKPRKHKKRRITGKRKKELRHGGFLFRK